MARHSDPTVRPQPVPRSDKRKLILRAGLQLFLEYGYADTSMDAITRRSGVSKPTVYSYFSSKEALFTAVVAEKTPEILSAIDIIPSGDTRTDLIQIARQLAEAGMSSEILACDRMIAAESGRNPELGKMFFDAGPGRVLQGLTDYFRTLGESGALSISCPEEAADFFCGILLGVLVWRNLLSGANPPHRLTPKRIERAVDAFVLAYTPTSTAKPSTKPKTKGRRPATAERKVK